MRKPLLLLAPSLQHCGAMETFADHAAMRAVEAGGMMQAGGAMMGGGGMRTGGGMMGAAGTDTSWMAGWGDAGWTMPGGAIMPFTHTLPQCAVSGG